MNTISIVNLKGGVGKTATAVNLAASLSIMEKKTLLIDADPQGNASLTVRTQENKTGKNIYDLLTADFSFSEQDAKRACRKTQIDFLKCMPADYRLYGIEKFIDDITLLNERLYEIKDDYDYIIIDTPPSAGFLTKSAIFASDWSIITLSSQVYELEGLKYLFSQIKKIKSYVKAERNFFEVIGFLFTIYDSFDNSDKSSADFYRNFEKMSFKTRIPRDNRFKESAGRGLPIALYDINASGARAYFKLAAELVDLIEEKGKNEACMT